MQGDAPQKVGSTRTITYHASVAFMFCGIYIASKKLLRTPSNQLFIYQTDT